MDRNPVSAGRFNRCLILSERHWLIGGLFDAYCIRPPYQQNDYLGRINGAKRQETREKRLARMLDELEQGDLYMKMKYEPAKKR